MPKLDQKGFIAQLLVLLLLGAGLAVGVYLVQTRTGWFSKAAPVTPDKPETSFELEAQADTAEPFADVTALKSVNVGQKFRVDVWVRSDIDPANLFVAKIKFPTDLLKVIEINKRGANSFVNQWIADPSFDNSSGDISIIGGVISPGLLTSSQSSGSVKGVSSTPNAKLATSYQGGTLSYLNEGEGRTVPIGYTMFIIADLSDGSALSGQIYISKGDDGKQDFSCPGGYAGNPTTGNSEGQKWCLVGDKRWGVESMNTSGRFISKAYTFTESGKYNVVVNAYTSTDLKGTGPGDQCSGNPFSGGPFDRNSAWSNCGPTSRMIVTVQAPSPTSPPVTAPTASINTNSATITKGQSVTLTWSSANSTKCFLMPPGVIKTVDPSGSDTFSPTQTTIYNLRCEGVGGAANSVMASTTVTVTTATPTAAPQPSQPQLMVPRLMASIIFEAKKAGNANIEFTDGSQILRNSDSLNVISAKKGFIFSITSAPKATLSLDPSNGMINQGCNFSVKVNLDTDGARTDGTDAILFYDPSKLTATSITDGKIYADYPADSIDTKDGKIIISGIGSAGTPFTGKGTLATVQFKVKDAVPTGSTQINFDFDPNNKTKPTDSNIIERGSVTDVLDSVVNGSYTVGTGSCDSQPSGSTCDINALATPINPNEHFDSPLAVEFTYAARYKSNKYVTGAQWDFEGDNKWDTDMSLLNGTIAHVFPKEGSYNVKLQLKMSDGEITPVCSKTVTVPIVESLSCTGVYAEAQLGKLAGGEDIYVVDSGSKTRMLVQYQPYNAQVEWKIASNSRNLPDGGKFMTPNLSATDYLAPTNTSASAEGVTIRPDLTLGGRSVSCKSITLAVKPAVQQTTTSTQSAKQSNVQVQNLRHDGDVNSDSKINLTDMSRLLAQFGQSIQSETDLNGDGVVNTVDVLLLRNILIKNGTLNGK